jgi:seryl-tRNA synthetase
VLDFAPKDHVALGEELGIIDFAAAAKISGARFSLLKGDGARLIRALYNFFLDEAEANGYIEHVVPYIVGSDAMLGTGQLPKFEEDLFKLSMPLNGSDAYLIPTAEVPLTNIHAGELLDSKDLPIKYAAMTPCFRSEAGSYGRDTRGLMRQHQFHKVEMVQFCTAEQASAAHDELGGHAEGRLQKLGLPYKVMMLSSGDTSFSAHICYDLEVWIPAQNTYREISSCSWFSDFQGRRMGARYKDPNFKKPQALHTINGSGLAVRRTAIAVIENYQQADGRVAIPEVLQKYMGGREFIRPTA